jgi:hypothetical protein
MIIKVDKILLDSRLAAGMIGGVTVVEPGLAAEPEGTSATVIRIVKPATIGQGDDQ